MGVHLYVAIYEVITGNNILVWESLVIWVDCEWNLQKRVIAFRLFDEKHTAYNIYRLIKLILEEYALINKIFAISFDNVSANTISIPELEKVYNLYLRVNFFVKDIFVMF